jgi:predicted tellurium resistance membrane protein TerC
MVFFTKEFQWLSYLGTIIGTLIGVWVIFLLIKKRKDKPSLFYIGLSGILLFIAVVMFITHEVILMLELPSEYITVALGWILGSVAAYIIYIGYTCPEWAKNRWLAGKL